MKNIVFAVGIGTFVLIGIVYVFTRFFGDSTINIFRQNPEKTPQYVSGEILVTLKPYTNTGTLDEFISSHPELSRKQGNLSLPSFATLSLTPYAEWQKKVSPSQKDDPKVRQAIVDGETQLHKVYENLKTNPLLSDSNIWDSFYSDIEPEKNYFAVIHIFFKGGVSQKEREQFFQQYPQLEIVQDNEESRTYTVKVPSGKEQYWISEFLKQEFVKSAMLNALLHVTQ